MELIKSLHHSVVEGFGFEWRGAERGSLDKKLRIEGDPMLAASIEPTTLDGSGVGGAWLVKSKGSESIASPPGS